MLGLKRKCWRAKTKVRKNGANYFVSASQEAHFLTLHYTLLLFNEQFKVILEKKGSGKTHIRRH